MPTLIHQKLLDIQTLFQCPEDPIKTTKILALAASHVSLHYSQITQGDALLQMNYFVLFTVIWKKNMPESHLQNSHLERGKMKESSNPKVSYSSGG